MKKFLFSCVVAVAGLTASQVSAQDYFCAPQCDPCCYDNGFEGFYIGGNVGAISHTAHRNDLDGFLTDHSGWSTIDTNVTAGALIGYDWQCGNKLLGVVADWNWANTDKRLHESPNTDSDNFLHNEFDWFTTIRARAGITVCDALVYLTGGAAVARFNTRWNDDPDNFRHNDTRWGWTGGVGTEFKLGCKWSVGAEWLFLQFNDHKKTFTAVDEDRFTFSHSDSAWVGRFTLNYRFGDLF